MVDIAIGILVFLAIFGPNDQPTNQSGIGNDIPDFDNDRLPEIDMERLKQCFILCKGTEGSVFAQTMEQMYRIETGHFTSGGWKHCAAPGMGAFSAEYPYGWPSLQKYGVRPDQVWLTSLTDSGNGNYQIAFENETVAFNYIRDFIIHERGGVVAKWHSTEPAEYNAYYQQIMWIPTEFVV